MFVKEICKEVLLLIGKPVEKAEEVRFVAQNDLCGYDTSRGGFSNYKGA